MLMLLPYAVYRWWVIGHDGDTFTSAYYFSAKNLERCIAVGPLATAYGIFGVFRLHWLVLVVAFFMCGLRNGRVRLALLLMASVAMTLLIAFDTTRMFCWAFPVLILGALELGKSVGQKKTAALLLLAWTLNFLLPPYTTTGAESHRLDSIRTHVDE